MGEWLSILGLGEDGPEAMPPASRAALRAAEVVFGGPRHLALVADWLGGAGEESPLVSLAGTRDHTAPPPARDHDPTATRMPGTPSPIEATGLTSGATMIPAAGSGPPEASHSSMPDLRPWPVPFSLLPVLAERGRRVVVLASGNPFWFGAGAGLARALPAGEWRAHPAPSTFALAAARMGWAMEEVACLGLHAAPLARLRPQAAPGARAIVLLRDGAAVAALARWLVAEGFGASRVTVLERLGGPAERVTEARAEDLTGTFHAPVAAAVAFAGGTALPCASGRPDDLFAHDGQITKRPVRALALSALAPRPGERLWDIGAGSGSIAIEWLMAHPTLQAVAVEADPARAARLRANADRLGQDRLILREGRAPEALADLPDPQAVFIGGGAEEALLTALWDRLAPGTRIVAHAVTLETEALLTLWHGRRGGSLLRIDLSEAAPLGRKRGWKAAYPVVQWAVTR